MSGCRPLSYWWKLLMSCRASLPWLSVPLGQVRSYPHRRQSCWLGENRLRRDKVQPLVSWPWPWPWSGFCASVSSIVKWELDKRLLRAFQLWALKIPGAFGLLSFQIHAVGSMLTFLSWRFDSLECTWGIIIVYMCIDINMKLFSDINGLILAADCKRHWVWIV
jgi:hypothetical protein